jgi:hypothetical protein
MMIVSKMLTNDRHRHHDHHHVTQKLCVSLSLNTWYFTTDELLSLAANAEGFHAHAHSLY